MTHKLLFIGNYGNRNIGDDAILEILSERYARQYQHYHQYVFVRHYGTDITRISRAQPLAIRAHAILWVFLNVHMIVIGGGGLFGAHMGPVARFIPLFALACRLFGKTIIYESVGVYSNTPWAQKMLLFLSMFTAQYASVRDATSWHVTAALRRFKKITLVQDPGFTIQPIDARATLDLLRSEHITIPKQSKLVGISVKRVIRDETTTRQMMIPLIETCQWLIDHGYMLLFIPFCHDPEKWSEKDVVFAQEIMAELRFSHGVFCVKHYYTPRQVAGMVALTHCFIGMRFHAQVFAHALKIPLLPIAYEEKRLDFIKKYDYPILPIDKLSSDGLVRHLTDLLEQPLRVAEGDILS